MDIFPKVYKRTHPEELGVVVTRLVIVGIVRELLVVVGIVCLLHLSEIHALVVGLQSLVELKDEMCHNIVLRSTLCYPLGGENKGSVVYSP